MTPGAAASRLYIGGYTASSGGHGAGISVHEREHVDEPWRLVQSVEADDPTFLVLTEGTLHAASETPAGRILSYTSTSGSLVLASVAASGGAAPCHVVRDPASGALVVANYTAGTIGALSPDPADPARVTRVLALPDGIGPVTDRQDQPHAHHVSLTPWGTLLVSDLGTDRAHEFTVDPATLEPAIVATHALPPGSGPRHLAWLPRAGDSPLLLVAGELDGRVHALVRTESGAIVVDHSVSAYVEGAVSPADAAFAGDETFLSHIEVAAVADGSAVAYVGVRGRDTITVLALDDDGRLAVRAEVPCGGHWPRHFALDGGSLYVANQLSDTVSVLPLDPATGVPGAPVAQLAVGSPSCVLVA